MLSCISVQIVLYDRLCRTLAARKERQFTFQLTDCFENDVLKNMCLPEM
jgi:hypothetical protein